MLEMQKKRFIHKQLHSSSDGQIRLTFYFDCDIAVSSLPLTTRLQHPLFTKIYQKFKLHPYDSDCH